MARMRSPCRPISRWFLGVLFAQAECALKARFLLHRLLDDYDAIVVISFRPQLRKAEGFLTEVSNTLAAS